MAFTLAHISDPHLSPLPPLAWKDYFSKRLLGWLNWKQKRCNMHRAEILAHLVDDLRAQNWDHVAVTGDIVNLGLPQEYEAARDWLRALAATDKVSFVPGNHDAYVRRALEQGLVYLKDWVPQPHPYMRTHGDIALIHVSSAIATAPFMASGCVGDKQLAQLAALLEESKHEGKFRILLIHHALKDAEWNKRLLDSDALQAVLESSGAELVLHGHLHRATHHMVGYVHVFGVPSASADPHVCKSPAGYALYRIDKNERGWSVDVTRRSIDENLQFKTTKKIQLSF